MNQREEEYVHFVSCMSNLNEAWGILQNIKKNIDHTLLNPAFQFALIEYSKPYKKTYGKVKPAHILGEKYIPHQYIDLHGEIIKARDQIHAHSDLTVDDAKVYVVNTNYGKHVGISKNVVYDTEMFEKIDDIIDLIEQSLDNMYEEVKRLESELPINS